MSVPAHVDGDGRPARETARRRPAGACVETRPRRPRARRVPARRESSRARSIPGPELGDQRPLESSSRVSPFEKTSHGCPRPAAAGGARIGADLEARLAVEAHRHSPKRQGQRPQDRSAVHSVAGSLEEREGESEPVEGGSEQPHGRCVQASGPFYFKDVTECSGDSFPRSDREPASAPGDLPEDRRSVRSGLPGTGAGASGSEGVVTVSPVRRRRVSRPLRRHRARGLHVHSALLGDEESQYELASRHDDSQAGTRIGRGMTVRSAGRFPLPRRRP